MMIKYGSLLIIFFSSMNNLSFENIMPQCAGTLPTKPQQKDFVFDRGIGTEIYGNKIVQYLRHNRFQRNITPAFKHIRVIEVTKEGNFKERGTLGSLEKERFVMTDRFAKHAMVNNAIYCDEVELAEDYDGKLYPIGTIVYRTKNLEKCPLIREYIARKKNAAEKTLQTKVNDTEVKQD